MVLYMPGNDGKLRSLLGLCSRDGRLAKRQLPWNDPPA